MPEHTTDRNAIVDLYDDTYAAAYPDLYLGPWQQKHRSNNAMLLDVIDGLDALPARWLDIGCGQAFQFSAIERPATKIGIDLSGAQLRRARATNADAAFVRADMRALPFSSASFDVVTCFWGAYCYLDDQDDILQLIDDAAQLVRPGGALYFEVLPPHTLATFNISAFAAATGFRVEARTPDYEKWGYIDSGGYHCMTSPPLDRFTTLLAPYFSTVDTTEEAFMVHCVARGRVDRRDREAHGVLDVDRAMPATGPMR